MAGRRSAGVGTQSSDQLLAPLLVRTRVEHRAIEDVDSAAL